MNLIRKNLKLLLSGSILTGLTFGVYQSTQSSIFYIEYVNIMTSQDQITPLTKDDVLRIMDIPFNRISLFTISLKEIENKLLRNEWIDSVQLEKQFPQTLMVTVQYKRPVALVRMKEGRAFKLSYLRENGDVFGKVNLIKTLDLPILSGCGESEERRLEAVRILKMVASSELARVAELSSLEWSKERGFRALIAYGAHDFGHEKSSLYPYVHKKNRTYIEIGQEVDDSLRPKFRQIQKVIAYLNKNSIGTRQIWADVGKKVVVKKSQGS